MSEIKAAFEDLPVEYVEWVDSHGLDGWNSKGACREEGQLLCRSIGFVAQESKDRVTLIAHESEYQFHSPMTIPKVAIKKRVKVKI